MEEFPRIKRLPPYVFNVTGELKLAARRRGEDIIDFSMGNPDGPTPQHIVDKLVETVQRPDTHGYSVSKGIPRLRRAICNWYQRRYGVELDPDTEAIVTIGSKEGIAHLALATLDRGDIVLVPNPSYPIHIYGPVIAGADIRHVPMTPGVDFFAELETRDPRHRIPKPKMLIVNFPTNPTTQCVELAFFEQLVAHRARARHLRRARPRLRRHRVRRLQGAVDHAGAGRARRRGRVLHDVEELQHGGLARRLHGRQPRAGAALARIKSYHDYGTFTPIQVASIVALEGPQDCVERSRRVSEAPRRAVQGLHEAGWKVESEGDDVRLGADSRAPTAHWARSSSRRSCWPRRRSRSRRASASATTATATCASR